MDIFKELTDRVLTKYSSGAFQYDLTEGFVPLREQVSILLESRGIKATPDTVNITSGSQGVLDAVAKLLISKGDKIALEAPTYLGALSAFNPYEPTYIRMDMDDEGLIPESLEETLKTHKIKFIYLVPTFQNPTGRTITLERRLRIADIIKRYNALLVEDDPYSALRYKGENIPAIKAELPKGFTCSPSDGGMFLWVTGPKGFDMIRLYHKAIENGVAFVPGKFFFTNEDEGIETMRLNYTMADEKTIKSAIGKIADTINTL